MTISASAQWRGQFLVQRCSENLSVFVGDMLVSVMAQCQLFHPLLPVAILSEWA
jgi:hypothetical protein